MDFRALFNSLKERIYRFQQSQMGRWMVKIFRWLFLAGILFWLGLNLYEIGWYEVWQNLPVHPLFYLLFLLMYFLAPLGQLIVYRLVWNFDLLRSIDAFIKKRILNSEVIGYSGEVYFYSWARNRVNKTDGEIAKTIRDNNILSAVASNALALLILGAVLLFSKTELTSLVGSASPIYFASVGLALIIIIPIVVRYLDYIFATPFRLAAIIFGIYFLRLTLGNILQIAMWEVVIPEVSLSQWLAYAAASILVSRIPVSNKKLIFVGVGVEMSAGMGIPEAALFGLLATVVAMEKILGFGLFLYFTAASRSEIDNEKTSSNETDSFRPKGGSEVSTEEKSL